MPGRNRTCSLLPRNSQPSGGNWDPQSSRNQGDEPCRETEEHLTSSRRSVKSSWRRRLSAKV